MSIQQATKNFRDQFTAFNDCLEDVFEIIEDVKTKNESEWDYMMHESRIVFKQTLTEQFNKGVPIYEIEKMVLQGLMGWS